MEVYQTILFCLMPLLFMLVLIEPDDDDDGPDGGLMTPVYQGTS